MNDYFLNYPLLDRPEILTWESNYDWYFYPYIYDLLEDRKLFLPRPYDCFPLHYSALYYYG